MSLAKLDIEKIILSIIIGFIPPVFLMLILWWTSFLFISETAIKWFALIGFILGLLIDIFLIKIVIREIYKLNTFFLIFIYFFYMIGLFGFFMGVPVFNILPGIIAGIYLGRRMHFNKSTLEKFNKEFNNLTIFNIISLIIFLSVSAYIALNDSSTAANLEGMFNLSFNLTYLHLWIIIISGGLFLLALQFILTKLLSNYFYKLKF